MREITLTVHAILVVWVIGFLLIRRIGLFGGRLPSFVYGAALGVGAGVVCLVFLITSSLTGELRAIWGYLVLVGLVVFNMRTTRKGEWGATPPSDRRWAKIADILLLGGLATVTVAMALSGTLGTLAGDGWAVWAFKAKVFFHSGRIDLGVLRDETGFGFAHLDYPLLLPLIEWWVYVHLGHVNDSVVRLVHVGYYLSLLAIFYGSLRSCISGTTALLCTLALALVGPGVVNTLDGYADLIQGYYALLGFVSFVAWVNRGQPSDLVSSGVSLALGAHVKPEGLGWLLAITVSIALGLWHVREELSTRLKPVWTFFAVCVPVAGAWPLYRWASDIPLSPVVMWPTLDVVVSRLPVILRALLAELSLLEFWQSGWGLLWGFVLLGGLRVLTHRNATRRQVLLCWSPLVVQGLFVFVVYLVTVAPLRWHLATSFTRVLLQFAPCCLWASVATLLLPEPFNSARALEVSLSAHAPTDRP